VVFINRIKVFGYLTKSTVFLKRKRTKPQTSLTWKNFLPEFDIVFQATNFEFRFIRWYPNVPGFLPKQGDVKEKEMYAFDFPEEVTVVISWFTQFRKTVYVCYRSVFTYDNLRPGEKNHLVVPLHLVDRLAFRQDYNPFQSLVDPANDSVNNPHDIYGAHNVSADSGRIYFL